MTERPNDTHAPEGAPRTPARPAGGDILAGIGMIALILAGLWAFWSFGGVVFAAVTPFNPIDRLSVCIIAAAILHAHFTTTKRSR
jgi:hypothetical protein